MGTRRAAKTLIALTTVLKLSSLSKLIAHLLRKTPIDVSQTAHGASCSSLCHLLQHLYRLSRLSSFLIDFLINKLLKLFGKKGNEQET